MAASRRGVLGGVAALLGGATISDSAKAAASRPDAELIALCGQFNALEHRINAIYGAYGDDDAAMDRASAPLKEEQFDLLDQIYDLPTTTMAGFVARANMLALWDPDFRDHFDEDGYWDDRMRAALLRDLRAQGTSS